jgi:predicted transcriptional regulator
MDLGSRKYIGSKAFIDSARGRSAVRDDFAPTADEATPAAVVATELILDCLNASERATAKDIAQRLDIPVEQLQPQLDKLLKLELASSESHGGKVYYMLTDYGQRARHFAKLS